MSDLENCAAFGNNLLPNVKCCCFFAEAQLFAGPEFPDRQHGFFGAGSVMWPVFYIVENRLMEGISNDQL